MDWLIFGGSVLALALVVWAQRRAAFPPDPPRWRSPGLSMSVRNGRIHFRQHRRKGPDQ